MKVGIHGYGPAAIHVLKQLAGAVEIAALM
jgi:hypothetical protein